MKNFKYIVLFLISTYSCSKKESTIIVINDSCNAIVIQDNFLIGKWKLLEYGCTHYRMDICEVVGSDTYSAIDYSKNFIFEIKSNGLVNLYEDDQLIKTLAVTSRANTYQNAVVYDLNCGRMKLGFFALDQFDNISNVGINDTIKILNQHINLNFENGIIHSKTGMQHFVKIE